MKNLTAHTRRTNNRRNLTIAATAIAALSFSSCSSLIERATEKAVEEGIEQAIEADTGEEIELDFDADNGTFSVETEDGSFSVDGEDGTFVIETEDGTIEGSGDENGFEVTSDDGSFSSSSGDAAWDLWPSDLPRPDLGGAVTVTGTAADDGSLWLLASGNVEGTPDEALAAFSDRLDGFTASAQGTNGESVWVNLTNDDYSLSVVVDGAFDPTVMSVTLSTGY